MSSNNSKRKELLEQAFISYVEIGALSSKDALPNNTSATIDKEY
jgi:hypothetical protein